MIHIHYFITRKEQLDDAAFHRYWRESHGPIAGRIKQLRLYVQSHRIPYAGTNSSYDGEAEVLIDSLDALAEMRKSPEYLSGGLEPRYDGVAQLWFENANAMRAAFESAQGRALAADGPKFIDTSALRYFVAQEHIVILRT